MLLSIMLLPFLFFLNVQIFLLLVFYEESLTGQHKDGDYVQILGTTCAVGVALEVELVYLWEVPWFIPGFSNPPAKYLRKALVRLPFGMAASGCLKDYKYNVTLWATDNIEFNLIHVCALTWCPKNVGHQTHASFFLSCFKEAGGVEVI